MAGISRQPSASGGIRITVEDDAGVERVVELDPARPTGEQTSDWDHPGAISQRTRDIITDQYLAAGSDALTADDAIQANANIPQELKDFVRATIQMHYLQYVALTGDRIQSVEDEYFPV